MREGLLPLCHLAGQPTTLIVVVAAIGLTLTLLFLAVIAVLGGALGPAPEPLFTAPFRWQAASAHA